MTAPATTRFQAVEPRTLWLDQLIARTGPSKGTAAGGAWARCQGNIGCFE